jgi:flagellar biosynthetic protein FliO
MPGPAPELPSYGSFLAVSFLSLGLVCLLAYLVLRWLGRLGGGRGGGPMRVLATCALAPRRTLHIVEVTGRYFLIGAGEGATSLIAELDAASLAAWLTDGRQPRSPFADTLARVMGRPRGQTAKP